jgi:hypothetical protein
MGGLGECVPYFMCKSKPEYEAGIEKVPECEDVFDQCCEPGDIVSPENASK